MAINPRHASIEIDGQKAGDYAAREVRAYFAGGEKSYKPTLQQDLKELTPKERVTAMLKLLEFVVPKAAQKTEITNKTTVVAFEGRLRELIDREQENISNALKAARKAERDAAAEDIIIPSGEDYDTDNELSQEYGDTTDNQET
jgi:hypothetical protein